MPHHIREKLAALAVICPPPIEPRHVFTVREWIEAGKQIGIRVPEQIVILNELYGSGSFTSIERPLSAGFAIWTVNLPWRTIGRLAELRELKENTPSRVPCPLYFERGGFLPIGRISDSVDIGLISGPELPDLWKVAILRTGTREFQIIEPGVLDLLIALANGTFSAPCFGKGMHKNNTFTFSPDIGPEFDIIDPQYY